MQRVEKWCGLSDCVLDVLPLLCCDGGMRCRTLVRHQHPEQIPEYPKAAWKRKQQTHKGTQREREMVEKQRKHTGNGHILVFYWLNTHVTAVNQHVREYKDTNHRHRIPKATQCIAPVSQLKAWPPQPLHRILRQTTHHLFFIIFPTPQTPMITDIEFWVNVTKRCWNLTTKGCCGQSTSLQWRRPLGPDPVAGWVWYTLKDKTQSG